MNDKVTGEVMNEAQKRAKLIRMLAQQKKQQQIREKKQIKAVPRDGAPLPLSMAQQRLWFVDQLEGSNFLYNMPGALTVEGEFDIDVAEQALSRIISRHEPLRTIFVEQQSGPVQVIREQFNFSIERYDLTSLAQQQQQQRISEIISEDRCRGFNLDRELMVRAMYIHLSGQGQEQNGIFAFNMHHIASDGWSKGILIKEFITQYQAVRASSEDPLPPLAIQYADYAVWQRQWLKDDVLEKQLAYWSKQLADAPVLHSLRLDNDRPDLKQPQGRSYHGKLDANLAVQMEKLAKDKEVTLFMLLHAALAIVIARNSNTPDVMIGTPVANRMQVELEPLIGFFVNLLVLRTNTDFETFDQYLQAVRQVNLDGQANQDVSFEQLVEHLNIPRSVAFTPLFQIMLTLSTQEDPEQSIDGLRFSSADTGTDVGLVAKFDLDIVIKVLDSGIHISWIYDDALFNRETIANLNAQFSLLLQNIVANPDASMAQLSLLNDDQQRHFVEQINATDHEFIQPAMVHQLFEAQVEANPDAIALECEQEQLSYDELNAQANQLANYLINKGLKVDTPVGICVDRSMDMVVGLLAIAKAGGAYVPLDPEYPEERIEYMVEDSGIKMVLANQEVVQQHGCLSSLQVCPLDSSFRKVLAGRLDTSNISSDEIQLQANHLAYIIYTSGTTGQPKGVLVEHGSVANVIVDNAEQFGVSNDSCFLHNMSMSFDAAGKAFWMSLCHGATLSIIDAKTLTGRALEDHIVEQGVSHLMMTPSSLRLLDHNRLRQVKTVIVGGEPCPADIRDHWAGHTDFFNAYGPTETTMCSLVKKLSLHEEITLGKPIKNTKVYVVGLHDSLVPRGVVGELLIGGAGIARGYLGQPQLTKERFINNLFDDQGGRLYRTGDLVLWNDNDELVYVGRSDDQVKIRGFRIELGEIVRQLDNLDKVESSQLYVHQDEQGHQRLVAYVIAKGAAQIIERDYILELRKDLAQKLPAHMLPAAIVCVSHWPLNQNGKVDFKALPEPDFQALQSEYEPPENEQEQILVDIWADLLNIEPQKLSVTANFFELGGDSILSIQIVSRAAEQGLHFTAKTLFSAQSIRQLVPLLSEGAAVNAPQEACEGEQILLPVQQQFFSDSTDLHHYNQAMMFTLPNALSKEALTAMVKALYERHDVLRLCFTQQDGQWQGEYLPLNDALVSASALVEVIPAQEVEQIEAYANQVQQSFDLAQGGLFRAVNIHTNGEGHSALLLVFHHLVIDGVSWRILLNDIETLYRQQFGGEPLKLAAKTSSYQQWGEFLLDYANSDEGLSQLDYWRENQGVEVKPVSQAQSDESGKGTSRFSVDSRLTEQLLGQANRTYRTKINELLLAGVLLGLNRFDGHQAIRLDLEGHGREALTDDLDLSQTLGWFTSFYPLTLLMPEQYDLSEIICAVKEQYRSIPQNGMGYGILKYLAKDPQLANDSSSELAFNYLGQFDQVVNEDTQLSGSQFSSGLAISENRQSGHGLSLNGKVVGGSLSFTLTWLRNLYNQAQMDQLMASIHTSLCEIIEHCVNEPVGRLTPSDFPLAKVDSTTLTRWQQQAVSEIDDLYPATGMQQGLLFHSMLNIGSYVTQTEVHFESLDIELFQQAWQQVIDRHGIFRTAFVGYENANVHQMLFKTVSLPWQHLDYSQLGSEDQAAALSRLRDDDRNVPFDPHTAPLMRMCCVQLGDDRQYLLWSHHHALLDGWCTSLVFGEVTECYRALQANEAANLENVPEYREYVAWLGEQDQQGAEQYWQEQLETFEQPTSLPLAATVPSDEQGHRLERILLDAEQTQVLTQLAKTCRTTVNVIVQAAWSLLLSRYNGTEQVVFGSVTSGRPPELSGVERMIGLFINSLPVVVDVDGELSVGDWLQQLHQGQVEREGYSFMPLSQIQQLTPKHQGQSVHNNLFDMLLVFENFPVDEAIGEQVEQADVQVHGVKSYEVIDYGICISAYLGRTMAINIEARNSLYSEQSIAQLAKHFKRLLLNIAQSSAQQVNDVMMLDEQELDWLIHRHHREFQSTLGSLTIPQLVEAQAAKVPNNVALVLGEQQMSYQSLNQQANRLANYLRRQGVVNQTRVGVFLNRSMSMVTAVLAILKAGGTYVPLDINNPVTRLSYILNDTGVEQVLTESELMSELTGLEQVEQSLNCLVMDDDDFNKQLAELSDSNLEPWPSQSMDDLAYIIYTSGTTGVPKGVMQSHQSVVGLFNSTQDDFNFCQQDVWLGFFSVAFDASVWEIWGPLFSGARMVIADDDTIRDPDKLLAALQKHKVTMLTQTPSAFEGFSQLVCKQKAQLPDLQHVVLCGEAMQVDRLIPWWQHFGDEQPRMVNMYGITETTVHCSYKWLRQEDVNHSNVGVALKGQLLYLLDNKEQPVPIGAVGEIHVGGERLAHGYHQLEKQTAERFVDNPWFEGRMYKSGDLARWLPNGDIAFIGRADNQVSIRGFRVELGEIQKRLLECDGVESCVVQLNEQSQTGAQLVAYVVAQAGYTATAAELKTQLSQSVPPYMVPVAFMVLDSWPLTVNGKIDKLRLPQIDLLSNDELYQSPQGETELLLVDIWGHLLKLDASRISANSNFFELGGHSLLAVSLITEIKSRFNLGDALVLKDVFSHPDLTQMANQIDLALIRQANEQARKQFEQGDSDTAEDVEEGEI